MFLKLSVLNLLNPFESTLNCHMKDGFYFFLEND